MWNSFTPWYLFLLSWQKPYLSNLTDDPSKMVHLCSVQGYLSWQQYFWTISPLIAINGTWNQIQQECIPVECVLPALYRTGGSPWQRPPWTKTSMDRNPPGQKPPGQRPPGQGTPPPVVRQTPVKTLPSQTLFAGGNNVDQFGNISQSSRTTLYLTPANEVWGKVIFSVACVKNSVHRKKKKNSVDL